MLTFNVILEYHARASYSDTSCDFLGFFFFFSVRPIDPISGKAFDAKLKKKGMALVYVRIRRENSRASLKAAVKHCRRQDKCGWNA